MYSRRVRFREFSNSSWAFFFSVSLRLVILVVVAGSLARGISPLPRPSTCGERVGKACRLDGALHWVLVTPGEERWRAEVAFGSESRLDADQSSSLFLISSGLVVWLEPTPHLFSEGRGETRAAPPPPPLWRRCLRHESPHSDAQRCACGGFRRRCTRRGSSPATSNYRYSPLLVTVRSPCCGCHGACRGGINKRTLQVRDFVRSALYNPNHGYFSKKAGPVGVLDSSIRFNQLEVGLLSPAHFRNLFMDCGMYHLWGMLVCVPT
jgi:hypothetical protein